MNNGSTPLGWDDSPMNGDDRQQIRIRLLRDQSRYGLS